MDYKRLNQEAIKCMRDPNDKRTMKELIKEFGTPELMREWNKTNSMMFEEGLK